MFSLAQLLPTVLLLLVVVSHQLHVVDALTCMQHGLKNGSELHSETEVTCQDGVTHCIVQTIFDGSFVFNFRRCDDAYQPKCHHMPYLMTCRSNCGNEEGYFYGTDCCCQGNNCNSAAKLLYQIYHVKDCRTCAYQRPGSRPGLTYCGMEDECFTAAIVEKNGETKEIRDCDMRGVPGDRVCEAGAVTCRPHCGERRSSVCCCTGTQKEMCNKEASMNIPQPPSQAECDMSDSTTFCV